MIASMLGTSSQRAEGATPPDPSPTLPARTAEEAYADILGGIFARKGLLVLLGEPRSGKSSLLRRLRDARPADAGLLHVHSCSPTDSFDALLAEACARFSSRDAATGRLQNIKLLLEALAAEATAGRTGILLLDDAHRLSEETLQHLLLLLLYTERAGEKLLQVVLAGELALEDLLGRPDLRLMKERVALWCRLRPSGETAAGCGVPAATAASSRPPDAEVLTPEALELAAAYSRGIPRLVNALCGTAWLAAARESRAMITARDIERAAAELGLDAQEEARPDPATTPVSRAPRWRSWPAAFIPVVGSPRLGWSLAGVAAGLVLGGAAAIVGAPSVLTELFRPAGVTGQQVAQSPPPGRPGGDAAVRASPAAAVDVRSETFAAATRQMTEEADAFFDNPPLASFVPAPKPPVPPPAPTRLLAMRSVPQAGAETGMASLTAALTATDEEGRDAAADRARIVIHYPNGNEADTEFAADIGEILRSNGFAAVELRPVNARVNSIRYFYQADRGLAFRLEQRLQAFLAEQGIRGVSPTVQDFVYYSPKPRRGTIEVWVAPTSP